MFTKKLKSNMNIIKINKNRQNNTKNKLHHNNINANKIDKNINKIQ